MFFICHNISVKKNKKPKYNLFLSHAKEVMWVRIPPVHTVNSSSTG